MISRKVWQVGAFRFTSIARMPNNNTWMEAPDAYLHCRRCCPAVDRGGIYVGSDLWEWGLTIASVTVNSVQPVKLFIHSVALNTRDQTENAGPKTKTLHLNEK